MRKSPVRTWGNTKGLPLVGKRRATRNLTAGKCQRQYAGANEILITTATRVGVAKQGFLPGAWGRDTARKRKQNTMSRKYLPSRCTRCYKVVDTGLRKRKCKEINCECDGRDKPRYANKTKRRGRVGPEKVEEKETTGLLATRPKDTPDGMEKAGGEWKGHGGASQHGGTQQQEVEKRSVWVGSAISSRR